MSFDQEPRSSQRGSTRNKDSEAVHTENETSEDGEGETPSYNIVPEYSAAYQTLLIILLLCVIIFAFLMGYQHYNALQTVKEEI